MNSGLPMDSPGQESRKKPSGFRGDGSASAGACGLWVSGAEAGGAVALGLRDGASRCRPRGARPSWGCNLQPGGSQVQQSGSRPRVQRPLGEPVARRAGARAGTRGAAGTRGRRGLRARLREPCGGRGAVRPPSHGGRSGREPPGPPRPPPRPPAPAEPGAPQVRPGATAGRRRGSRRRSGGRGSRRRGPRRRARDSRRRSCRCSRRRRHRRRPPLPLCPTWATSGSAGRRSRSDRGSPSRAPPSCCWTPCEWGRAREPEPRGAPRCGSGCRGPGSFSALRLSPTVTDAWPGVSTGRVPHSHGRVPWLWCGRAARDRTGAAPPERVESRAASWDTKGLSRGQPSCSGRRLSSWRAEGAGAFPSEEKINPATLLLPDSLFIFAHVFFGEWVGGRGGEEGEKLE